MSHVVSPISYRNGKTFLWFSNINVSNHQKVNTTNYNFLLTSGLSKIIKKILAKKRCYLVKSSIRRYLLNNKLFCKILFMPRIKKRPKPDGFGFFSNNILYKNINFNERWLIKYKNYAQQRQLKNFLFISQKNKKQSLNKWLTNRMLRGSKKQINIKTDKINMKKINKLIYQRQNIVRKNYHFLNKVYNIKKILLKNKNQWIIDILKQNRTIIHNKLFSLKINKMTGLNLKIYCLNIWSYLIKKKLLNFKNHQQQMWHPFLKKMRFWYMNYFDIVNAFFILSCMVDTEQLLFDTIKMVLPVLDKNRRDLKKFIYNLDRIIKKMPFIQNSFTCFRLNLTGKYQGGSKRTKQIKIGFGRLSNNSLYKNDKKILTEFTHRFGAFGVELFMQRRFIKDFKMNIDNQINFININK